MAGPFAEIALQKRKTEAPRRARDHLAKVAGHTRGKNSAGAWLTAKLDRSFRRLRLMHEARRPRSTAPESILSRVRLWAMNRADGHRASAGIWRRSNEVCIQALAMKGRLPCTFRRRRVATSCKLARRASSLGATSRLPVPRAPSWDMCPNGLAMTQAQ